MATSSPASNSIMQIGQSPLKSMPSILVLCLTGMLKASLMLRPFAYRVDCLLMFHDSAIESRKPFSSSPEGAIPLFPALGTPPLSIVLM
jgi:hypothetical protein